MSDIVYKKDDLLKTSYGIGHVWHSLDGSVHMPISSNNPLPAKLDKTPEVTTTDHYQTTSRIVHNYKQSKESYGFETISKPPAHYNVHYNKDLHEKLQSETLRRPLTMGNQLSETRDEFSLKTKLFEPNADAKDHHGFQLKDHLKDVACSSTEKKELPRTAEDIKNSIYLLNDPYLTTYQKAHRMYDPDEVFYATKKLSDTDPAMVQPQELPMRDKMTFKTAAAFRNVPAIPNTLPHLGMKTEYRENYDATIDTYSTCTSHVPSSMHLDAREPTNPVYCVPHFYKTEYGNIGSKCRQAI